MEIDSYGGVPMNVTMSVTMNVTMIVATLLPARRKMAIRIFLRLGYRCATAPFRTMPHWSHPISIWVAG
jgi:hypothetical protein